MFHLLVIAAAWAFQVEQDPLGQAVYVAEIRERPGVGLQFSCGGIVGVVLQYNLGDAAYADKRFSTAEPEWEDVRFDFAEGPYDTTAKLAPITDGIGAYEIKGSDAAFIAGLFQAGGSVSIKHDDATAAFSLEGAGLAIGQVFDACPFKYPA